MFGFDPTLSTIIVAGGIFAVSYLLGFSRGSAQQETTNEQIIAATIDHLINDGYLRSDKNAQGEEVLVKIVDIINEHRV